MSRSTRCQPDAAEQVRLEDDDGESEGGAGAGAETSRARAARKDGREKEPVLPTLAHFSRPRSRCRPPPRAIFWT